jgi:beta-ketoacyl-acyl-carrier-protein synthase II
MHSTNGQPRRVVITGIGAVTPLGLTIDETWDGLLAGRSGIGTITRFDTSELNTRFAGELKGFEARNYMDRKEARRLDPYIQYALAATEQALKDSEIDLSKETPTDMGVLIASGTGGVTSLIDNVMLTEKRGLRKVSPFLIPNMLVDSAAGKIAIVYNMRGPNFSVVNACASGTAATGEAFELIRRGDAQVMVTGGAEAALLPVLMAGFDIMGAMSQRNDEPAAACRPFDTDRDGFVMSEGSAILILELLEHALARDARIYAEIIGYGNSADAYHMAAPHFNGQGAEDAMNMAMRKAESYGVKRTDVDYVNAHGTGTELNDPGETKAIKRVLGEHAYNVNISSTKAMLGHLLGAAGAIEAIVCLKAIEDGVIPPTINLDNPDPSCDLNYTPLRSVRADVAVTVSNSFGFGGHNSSLILRRFEENGA